MRNKNSLMRLWLLIFAAVALLTACSGREDATTSQRSCADIVIPDETRLKVSEVAGEPFVAQIFSADVQCRQTGAGMQHTLRITLRAGSQNSRLPWHIVSYSVLVKDSAGRALASRRVDRKLEFRPGQTGAQITDFVQHTMSDGAKRVTFELRLD